MNTLSCNRIALFIICLTLLTAFSEVEAKSSCTLKSINGTYGYIVNGTNLTVGAVAAVGIVSSDGSGNLAGTDTLSVNGLIFQRTITGTYTVNPDCTGAVIFTDNLAQTTHLDFVLIQDREELNFIQTDAGTIITGTGRKR